MMENLYELPSDFLENPPGGDSRLNVEDIKKTSRETQKTVVLVYEL